MAYSDVKGVYRFGQMYELIRYKLKNRGRFADVKYHSFKTIRAFVERELGSVEGMRLLEVGCGQWQANVKLFDALGADVIAVDPELPPRSVFGYASFARISGVQRAVKTFLSEAFMRRAFEKRLQELSGLRFGKLRAELHRVEGEQLPIADESVDAAFSDDVFEHLSDVSSVTAEIARVLKPSAPVLIIIHPFAAYSGGHHLATIRHGGEVTRSKVPPWDHLRENQFPSGVYLNMFREHEFRQVIASHLEVATWERLGPEGEDHLTDEIVREIPGYDRDELLVGKIVCVARKQ